MSTNGRQGPDSVDMVGGGGEGMADCGERGVMRASGKPYPLFLQVVGVVLTLDTINFHYLIEITG